MKKLLVTTLALAVGASFAYSQGTITIANTTAANLIRTNTTQFYGGATNTAGGASGVTAKAGLGFRYTVLMSEYGGAVPILDPLNEVVWGETGAAYVNHTLTAGGISGGASYAVSGWDAPTGAGYNTGTTMYYIIVGWSSNLGADWATASASMRNTAALDPQINYFFGTSPVGFNVAGGGPSGLTAVNLFSTSQTGIAGTGLGSGFNLYLVPPIPEPTSFALAGLGAAALLIFRRRR